ncbi:NAD(P)-binding domain-containing protein [Actinoplanes aureus]|uniref:NAD(P)/FAD-dependent oxidoreductase n=1 Tax=Actinoplanes aureus TaxID=2792083 RepID=A0A931G1J5_9ACTN|nr:NAD(P)-binding domain-containing protein [Actinoplanes aureus]MBG0566757.1 NAD(P)/FAD-dependent oxidoreductase [Actinoplanes aureus]
MNVATVLVVGGGQSGLSAGYHLKRRGFASALTDPSGDRTFVILDAAPAPGGAWRERWESLRMATVNGIFDLPGFPKPPLDPGEPSRTAVPRYFASFEHTAALPILRPVQVTTVRPGPGGGLIVESDQGRWATEAIINATGTWTNPVRPRYPGQETFTGLQLHTRDYVSARQLAGLRVAVVGGGISAVQLLEEISQVATTFWYTRREPVFRDDAFEPETAGREIIAKVTADVEAGRPTGSVVSYTDLIWTPYALAAKARGALERRPMFAAIEPHGVREADGSFTSVDAIVWATGFRAALAHLDPLGLRNEDGGIRMDGTQVTADPRVHLVGFGPSQSTVGANRAGRDAVSALVRYLDRPKPAETSNTFLSSRIR